MSPRQTSILTRFLSTRQLLDKAARLRERGDRSAALELVNAALRRMESRTRGHDRPPAWCRARFLAGELYRELGETESAADALLDAYEHTRGSASALSFLTEFLLANSDRRPAARRAYLDFLQLPPDERPANFASWTLRLREVARPVSENRELAAECRSLNAELCASADDRIAWPHLHMGQIHLLAGDLESAVVEFSRACALDSGERDAPLLLASVLLNLGRAAEALQYIEGSAGSASEASALLCGHAWRALGQPARAVEAFTKAWDFVSFTWNDRLAFVESLVAAGDTKRAREIMPSAEGRRDDMALALLEALILEAEGERESCLRALHRLLHCEALADQACSRILAIAAETPDTGGVREALAGIPEQSRNDMYWSVIARVEASEPEGVIAALARTTGGDPNLTPTLRDVLLHALEALAEDPDRGLHILGSSTAPPWADPRDLAPGLAKILLRHTAVHLPTDLDGRRELRAWIDRVNLGWPALSQEPAVALLVDALSPEESGSEVPEASVELALATTTVDAETLTDLACCFVLCGQRTAPVVAQALPEGNARNLLDAANAALRGEWELAWHRLSATGSETAPEHAAAILMELGALEPASLPPHPGVLYYRAVDALGRGASVGALQQLEELSSDSIFGDAARSLLGWWKLRAMRDAARRGDPELFRRAWKQVNDLWPVAANEIPWLRGLQLAIGIAGEERSMPLADLLLPLSGQPAWEPRTCHAQFVLHLADGVRCAGDGDARGTIAAWEESIACLGIALTDERHLTSWLARRARCYGSSLGDDARSRLREDVMAYCDALFRESARSFADRVELRSLELLPILLRAELRGAERLHEAVGAEKSGDWVVGGACALSRSESEEPLAGIELAGNPRAFETLGILFSSLRVPALLFEEGSLTAALQTLRDLGEHCRVASPACGGPLSSQGCGLDATRLARCSPAFANSPARLREQALELEARILVDLGARALSESEILTEEALRFWSEAAELPLSEASRRSIGARMSDLGLGRARTLQEAGRYDAVVELLDAVRGVWPSSDFDGLLAESLTTQAVRLADGKKEWPAIKPLLERARGLNPFSRRVGLNLLICIENWALDLQDADPPLSRRLCAEGFHLAQSYLAQDPQDKEIRELSNRLRLGQLDPEHPDPAKLGELMIGDVNPTASTKVDDRNLGW